MALLSAAEARAWLPSLTGPAEDTTIDTFISRMDGIIAEYLGFPPASTGAAPTADSATYTLYSDAGGYPVRVAEGGTVLRLPARPVTSVTSIHIDPLWEHGASTLVASTDYVIDGDAGEVRLKPTRTLGAFSTGPRVVKVVCVAGYSTTPGWLEEAAGLTFRHAWGRRHTGSAPEVAQGDATVRVSVADIPPDAREILDPHRILWSP
jgi:hypothetical protein